MDSWGGIECGKEEGDASLYLGDDLGDHAFGWSELVDTPDFVADLVGGDWSDGPAGGGGVERKDER